MSKYLEESYDALLKENSELIEQHKKVLQRLERYENGLREISRYTHPDYPFKGESLISEIHTLINLALKEE